MYRSFFVFLFMLCSLAAVAQRPDTVRQQPDTLPQARLTDAFVPEIDTTIDYDEFFDEMTHFLDSMLRPRSYLQASVSGSTGFFNYKVPGTLKIQSKKRFTYSPTLSYYNKLGLGLTATGNFIAQGSSTTFYQASVTPSFDYLSDLDFATGISYTRFISKDSLPFYLSPLQNDVTAYFVYRKTWLWPSVSASYGWGSRKDLEERLSFIRFLRLRRRLTSLFADQEKVNDVSVTAAVSHNFYWLDVLKKGDNIRVSPQFMFTGGTQQYGFNRIPNRSSISRLLRNNSVNSNEGFSLASDKKFEALSIGFLLRTEYSIRKFFIQPELTLDYYLPDSDNAFNALFAVNLGFNF